DVGVAGGLLGLLGVGVSIGVALGIDSTGQLRVEESLSLFVEDLVDVSLVFGLGLRVALQIGLAPGGLFRDLLRDRRLAGSLAAYLFGEVFDRLDFPGLFVDVAAAIYV